MSVPVALLGGHTGPVGDIGIAGAIDETARAHRDAAGLGLEQQRVEAAVRMTNDACRKRMEQQLDSVIGQQRIGGALERRHVVGLRVDLAEHQMRFVQAIEPAHPHQQVIRDAMHDLADVAKHVGMQAAEVRHAGGGAHPAEEAVAFGQQHPRAIAGGCRGCADAGGAAAQYHHVKGAEHRDVAPRLRQRVPAIQFFHRRCHASPAESRVFQ